MQHRYVNTILTFVRCKHLCCHEGVDKPPKAPKKIGATNTPVEETKGNPISRGPPKQNTVQGKLQMGKSTQSNDGKGIETVNLAHKRDPDEYAKVAPRAYRSLHQLHEKVNKDGRTPTMSNIKPSFSFKEGEQPTLSFLGQTGSSSQRNQEPSSDYDSGFLDDFPSPSALLSTSRKETDDLNLQAVDHDNTGKDLGIFRYEHDKLGDDGSDVDPAIFADTEYEEAMESLGPGGYVEASHCFPGSPPKRTGDRTAHDKLFMSTDSPVKPSSLNKKRKTPEGPDAGPEEEHVVHKEKKQKVDNASDAGPLGPLSGKGNQDSTPAPTIKAGYPAWVYEFDPELIAEWEPYAEFV